MTSSRVIWVVVLAVSPLVTESATSDPGTDITSLGACLQRELLEALDDLATGGEDIRLNRYIRLVKNENALNEDQRRSPGSAASFLDELKEKVKVILRTHDVRVFLTPPGDDGEGGRRLRYKKAFPLMVAGFVILSSFMVPLGFQFMAMLGGKALLLSIISVLLSLYQGFNKQATHHQQYHQQPFLYKPWRRQSPVNSRYQF